MANPVTDPAPPIGAIVPQVLLPKPGVDLGRWAVIACDQFTSEPEYWREVARLVGDAPSTYHMILPEVFLDTPEEARRIAAIRQTMHDYLERDLFDAHQGLVLVERKAGGKTRHGLMLALDLEEYDYARGSTSLIRATEGTILERIPPRVRIRSGAPLEAPHILVLIDDPARTVIEPLVAARGARNVPARGLPALYDFDLMLGSGRLSGYLVDDGSLERHVLDALRALADPEAFARKYGLPPGAPVMLFAMGDGNHSLATAKAIWEQRKGALGMEHPSRYALVEIENIHDPGLEFEPIHRVLFGVTEAFDQALRRFYGDLCHIDACDSAEQMAEEIGGQFIGEHVIGVISPDGFALARIAIGAANLPVGALQAFLDDWEKRGGFSRIDYVHGEEVVERLGRQPGNLGFLLPVIRKSDFFKTVILDGALPRKTFSMGEAREKRFYLEARRIE